MKKYTEKQIKDALIKTFTNEEINIGKTILEIEINKEHQLIKDFFKNLNN